MRAHHAASNASAAREKCTRPSVVGPSPVITPSRTTPSAKAALSRQEILAGSRAAMLWANSGKRAFIGTVSRLCVFGVTNSMPDVNEWLKIRNFRHPFFTASGLTCQECRRFEYREAAGRDGGHKRQNRGNRREFGANGRAWARDGCFAAQTGIERRCYQARLA